MKTRFGILQVVLWLIAGNAAEVTLLPVSQLPLQTGLPDPLVGFDGQKVTSKEQWIKQRRPELVRLFQHYMYGYLAPSPSKVTGVLERRDPNFFSGKATKEEYALSFGPPTRPNIHLLLVTPNAGRKPAPVFLGLNFCGNYSVVFDPTMPLPKGWMPSFCEGCTNNQATEAGRGKDIDDWAIEHTIARGYAVATFYNGDIDPDKPDYSDGIHPCYARPGQKNRDPNEWGSIAAWAWGLHRAVDFLHQHPGIDTNRIAVFGHSRNGKTALLAAALDERVDLVIPHQAGCGGTAPSRGKIGESVKQINDQFPHWFDDEFKQFNTQTDRLPFDQHCLIALCAPRPVLLSNAVEDTWANPAGQFEMLKAADPTYRLLGAAGLGAREMPAVGKLVDSRLGYYIRPGKHSTTPEDWQVFVDFADRHFGKPNR